MASKNMRPRVIAQQDQDWAEAIDWIMSQELTTEIVARQEWLFTCDADELRTKANIDELDMLQRLARLAWNEAAVRGFDRLAMSVKGGA